MIKRILFFFCSLFALNQISAQDLHFTYFEFAPQSVSPALLGNFSGSYRLSGIIRDQYNLGNGLNGFRTLEAGVDAPIIRGIRKQDWVGVGLSIDSDSRGEFSFKDVYSRFGLSYHLAFNKEQTSYLSVGAQRVGVSRRINNPTGEDLTGNTIVNGGMTDPDLIAFFTNAEGNVLKDNFSDWVGGVSFTNVGANGKFTIGGTGAHFLKNNINLGDSAVYDQPFRFTGFMMFEGRLNEKVSFEPAVLVQTQSSAFEATLHAVFGYKLSETSNFIPKAGLGFRTGTASAQIFLGGDYKGLRAGLSYDLPLTGFSNAQGIQNAIEIGVSYIGTIKKTPKPKPTIICPRI